MQKVSEGQTREDGHLPQPKTHPSRTRKLFGFSTLEWDVLNKARILEARQKGAAVSDTSATRGRDYTQTASAKCAPAATLLCGADVAPFEVWEEEKVRGACLDMLSRVAPGQERRRPPNGLLFDISLNVLPCLAEFFENDGLGIGKVPLRLSADVAGLKEEIARRAAATQPHREAEAHLLTAVSSGPPSNPSASSNRPRTGKTSGEAPHPAAGNRGGVSPGASDSTGPPAQDSACASIALAVSNEKAAAELCLQNAGAAATPSVAALLSSERELSVTQVIEWLLHRPWVRREDTHVKHDVDKLYADAQAQLAHGKDAEAATTAAAVSRAMAVISLTISLLGPGASPHVRL
ncbi:hypothetical protein BESB_005630 [Besnoitia besnoiti]|uniref:Uncharacterized protein n=1 Tax=Besnoitia besnoiti TaxID=94643 RepID=A0A2A9MQF0_BESBE|nr:hypothetical protein BESB_005630 [Besnoitia besnoiti]PFH38222.1 hypothetical protein BESB_005630 [Besnoitia besnoiti]